MTVLRDIWPMFLGLVVFAVILILAAVLYAIFRRRRNKSDDPLDV